jgi:hypothetical protein
MLKMESLTQTETEAENRVRRRSWPPEGDHPMVAGDAQSVERQLPEQRIRAVFAQSGNGALPRVSQWALSAYYEYLVERLSFPFAGRYWEEVNPLEGVNHVVTVEALVSPQKRRPDVFTGLLCLARLGGQAIELPLAELELGSGTANARLVEDYWYWLWNWRADVQ